MPKSFLYAFFVENIYLILSRECVFFPSLNLTFFLDRCRFSQIFLFFLIEKHGFMPTFFLTFLFSFINSHLRNRGDNLYRVFWKDYIRVSSSTNSTLLHVRYSLFNMINILYVDPFLSCPLMWYNWRGNDLKQSKS